MQMSGTITRAHCGFDSTAGTVGRGATVSLKEGATTVILKRCSKREHIVHINDALRTPVSRALRHSVHELLRRGERRIVVDLSALSKIDAAGVGELIRAFNMTAAVNGGLRVVNTTAWVREILERAQLFKLLAGEDAARQQFA